MGFFNKIWSGLDFWQGDENRGQRDQRAQEEEEERRRREQEARERAFSGPRPGAVVQPTETLDQPFDFSQPLKKSAFGTAFNNPIIEAANRTPEQVAIDTDRANKQKIIDDLYESNLERARADSTQGEGFIGRNLLNRKAIEERAQILARNRATQQFQEKYGYNKDPEVLAYGADTKEKANAETERIRKQGADLDDFSRKLTKAGEIASYVPVTGSVMNLGLAGTEKLAKATGNEAYGKDIEDQRLAIDLGMTPEEFKAIDLETQQKLRNLQTLGLALSPLDFLGVGGLAKSGVVSAGKAGFKEAIEGGIKSGTKNALKKASTQLVKETAVPVGLGIAASVGAQTYLGGTENIDPLEAGKTGLLVGSTSLLFPSQGIRKAGQESIDEAARASRAIDEVDDAAKQIDNIENEAEASIKDAVEEKSPTPEEPKPTVVDGKPALEVEEGIKSTNLPTVPDVTNPIALAKAAETAGTAGDVPIASFNNPVDGSQLQKAAPPAPAPLTQIPEQQALQLETPPPEVVPAKAVVGPVSEVDALGNPVLKSDAQRAQELADAGMAPARGDSVAAQIEGERQAAADAAVNREVTETPASLRERQAFAATEEDPVLAQEILDSVPGKAPMNVEESLSVARNNARAQAPEQLIASWGEGRTIDQNNAQAWVNALEERKVLNAMVSENVPGARQARLNLADAMSQFQSKSGQNLNILKVAYDEMPSDMKTELLIKKIDRARKKAGMDSLGDQEMSELLARVETADGAANRLKAIENEMADFNRAITSGSATPESRQRLNDLTNARDEALANLYERNAVVTDYFSQVSPDSTFGQKLANWNRVSMLSSVTGRIFDLASTAGTTTLDTINKVISSVIAKGLNGRVGSGGAKSTLPQILPGFSDLKKAGQRTIDSARGKNQVRDVMAEIQGAGTGRSELQNQSRGKFRNLVKAGTEAPTEATRFIEDSEVRRSGYQKAQELGLSGDDADLYADSYSAVATAAEKYSAQQEHLKVNMLHNNIVSSKIDAVSNTLLNSNSKAGKSAGAILKSVVAPFTRFIGGMTHRTFTDMNVLHNAWEVKKAIKNGDTQMLSNALAKMATNTTIGFATATVLAESGVLTETDANGDSYAGLYFHVGDRYIPVGFAGLASVPMIVGYGLNKASNAESPADAFTAATTDTLSRVLASTGTAGFFGADNALQTAIGGASSAISPSASGSNERDMADVLGSSLRQSIPAGLNDVNAVLNQLPGVNPTGEAAETKVLNEDGTQNPAATQVAKTQNTIPGLSQLLPRKEGTPARDLIDRATKGNRETGEMSDERNTKQKLTDWEKSLTDEGIPTTVEKIGDLAKTGDYEKAIKGAEYHLATLEADKDATENSKITARRSIEDYKFGQEYGYVPSSNEAVEARAEKGQYASAVAGWNLRLKRDEEEGNTPESKLNSQRRKIKRYEVYDEKEINPGMAVAYEKTDSDDGGVGVTRWREMMDSGDPKLVAYAEQLYNLDKALLDAGAVKEPKYYWGKGGRGGGRGRKGPKFSTNIATQGTPGYSFAPIKAQGANFGQPGSAIPRLEKVASYSRKPKKISVKRGNKA